MSNKTGDPDPLLVTARLLTELGGTEAPQLDGLLEWLLSLHHHKGEPGYKIDRSRPAPPQGQIPIPLVRRRLGPWLVGACSNPILGHVASDRHDHVAKRISVENAGLLAPDKRVVVATTNSWTKSYRLPLRSRIVPVVSWFAMGDRRELLHVLRRCTSLGKKVSIGKGRVAEWTVERIEHDYSWFAPSEYGLVLMRSLPIGPWLPDGLIGARHDYRSCVPPYWHPERHSEAVVPV